MGKNKTPPVEYTAEEEAALRSAISDGFRTYTQDAEARGVTYKLGAKDGVKSLDCAGYIDQAARAAFGNLENGDAFVKGKPLALGGDDQVRIVGEGQGRTLLKGDQVNLQNLKEGMILGIDRGPVPWAPPPRVLWNQISHVALIYRDPEKGLMVAQANVQMPDPDRKLYNGVHAVPLEFWLKRMQNSDKIKTLYAADMVPMAKSYGAKATGDTPVVAATTQTTPATTVTSTVNDNWLGNKPVPDALQNFRNASSGPAGGKSNPLATFGAIMALCWAVSLLTGSSHSPGPRTQPAPT